MSKREKVPFQKDPRSLMMLTAAVLFGGVTWLSENHHLSNRAAGPVWLLLTMTASVFIHRAYQARLDRERAGMPFAMRAERDKQDAEAARAEQVRGQVIGASLLALCATAAVIQVLQKLGALPAQPFLPFAGVIPGAITYRSLSRRSQ